jgi:hypothetical protein
MAVYTLVIPRPNGFQTNALTTFQSDELAINDAGIFTSAENPSVAVARGSETSLRGAKIWTPED